MRAYLLILLLAGLVAACSDNGETSESAESAETTEQTEGEDPADKDIEAGQPVEGEMPPKPDDVEDSASEEDGGDASADEAQESSDETSTDNADESAQDAQASARAPEGIYEDFCTACHEKGMAGAPKLDDTDEWQSRIDERGLDGLVQNSIDGYNAMPAQGTCMDCSEEEMTATVEWMLNQAEVSF